MTDNREPRAGAALTDAELDALDAKAQATANAWININPRDVRTLVAELRRAREQINEQRQTFGMFITDASAQIREAQAKVVTPPAFAVGQRVRLRETARVHLWIERGLFNKVLTIERIEPEYLRVRWGTEIGEWFEGRVSFFEAVD